MTKLFPTLDDLKPFIFRITDNGGESADRFTVVTCDGDYYAMSSAPFHPQGVGMTGEGIDVQGMEDRVECGDNRDLRWIDLPADCQRCVLDGLNMGFQDYIESEPYALNRKAAISFEGWSDFEYRSRRARERGEPSECIYLDGDAFKVRRDDDEDAGPFATFAEAFRYTLPEDYDLSGPEYHTGVDLWDTEGGPAPLWDRETDPPVIDPQYKTARVSARNKAGTIEVWFATEDDAQAWLTIRDDLHEDRDDFTVMNPEGW